MQIYKLTSPSNKIYIGKTKHTFYQRWRQHIQLWKQLSPTKDYTNGCPKLYYAFDKYPPKEWLHEILYECDSLEELNQKEIEFIEQYNSIENGYNITKGGDGRLVDYLEEEHKRKISEARTAWFQTEDGLKWKKHLSISLQGNTFGSNNKNQKRTDEQRKNISDALKASPNNKGELNPFYGHTHKEDSLQTMSIKKKQNWENGIYDDVDFSSYKIGKPRPESQKQKAREALQQEWNFIDPQGNKVHIINLLQFCKENKLDQGNMVKLHQGKSKSCKGWKKA